MTILFILITILLFSTLVVIREFGHFIAAKALGVQVEEFTINMGPRLLSRVRGEMAYSLRTLPTEGFCSMEGEERASDDPRSFNGKPAWKGFIILVAGAFLNLMIGLVILLVLFSVAGSPSAPMAGGHPSEAEDIRETSLLPDGKFYHTDGHRIYPQSNTILFLDRMGEDMAVEALWDGRRLDLDTLHLPYHTLTDENDQQSLKREVIMGELWGAGPLGTLRNAWHQSIDYVRTMWLNLGDLTRGVVSLNDMAGPTDIFATTDEVGQQGAVAAGMTGALLSIFNFVVLITINLAVMNLLPIPTLNGGQTLFLLVGGIYHFFTHRRIDQKYLGYISMVNSFRLIALTVVVAVNDVDKLTL